LGGERHVTFIDPTTDFGFKKFQAMTVQFGAIKDGQTLQVYLPRHFEGNNV
jgi:hypothetical protein